MWKIFKNEPKNLECLEAYLTKLSINSFWYFDYGATRHVKGNNDLSISLKNFFHKNTIIIAWK
jgi:hypothetical protein